MTGDQTLTRIDAGWVIPVEPPGVLRDHSVLVGSDGRILAVEPTAAAAAHFPTAVTVDLRGHALIPGLVNAHTHAAMTLLRGLADDLPLRQWLTQRIWPIEGRLVDEDFVADGTQLACLEMALGGTTTFNDMYFFPLNAIKAAMAVGIRIQAGLVYVDAATRYAAGEAEHIARGLAEREAFPGDPRVTFALAPHATYTTSPGSLPRLQDLMVSTGLPVHTHVHESAAEVAAEQRRFGMSGVQRLAAAGVLSPGFAGAHCVHMSAADIDLMATTGASAVHCPSSNLKLASGIAPVWQLASAGVNVAIGTDGAASNNRLDMFGEMRTAALLAKGATGRADALPAHRVLRMATLGGAIAMGRQHEIGSLMPGKWADVVAVDLSGPMSQPCYDPVSHLIYVADRRDVSHVWVGGRPVVVQHRCVTLDPAGTLERVRGWQQRAVETPD